MTARVFLLLLLPLAGAETGEVRPGVIAKEDLKEYDSLTGQRKKIVDEALELAARDAWIKYVFGRVRRRSLPG